MTAHQLTLLANEANANGWTIRYLAEHPARDGRVPNGVALIERDRSPSGPGREFSTNAWAIREADGAAGFFSGEYDLTYSDAIASFAERAGILAEVAA